MTQKHYIVIARMLKDQRPIRHNDESQMAKSVCNAAEHTLASVTLELATIFKQDNPRFKAGKFFDAAGFPELTNSRMGLG